MVFIHKIGVRFSVAVQETNLTEVRLARMKEILTLWVLRPNQSLNDSRYTVMDPALCGHVSGEK